MIGSKAFRIKAEDFIKSGMSTSADSNDGAFSPETDAVNLIAQPGVLNAPASPTDKSGVLSGNIIAGCEDPTGSFSRLKLTDSGKFYTLSTSFVLALIATDGTRAYTPGKSDMTPFGPYVYGTSGTYVWEWQVTGATINQTYFAFPSSSGSTSWSPANVPHPTLTFEGNVFYGNGPQLLRQTTVGGTPAEIMLLDGSQTIVALGIDPGSGKMLISTTTSYNLSDTLHQTNKVHYYDGYSNKTLKTTVVDDMVTAFYNVVSTTYVGYGQNLGYWNGSGIRFLRHLTVDFDNTQLPYKHHFTNNGSTLYVTEKTKLLAYGPVQEGGKSIFYYAYSNNLNSNNLLTVSSLGQNILGIGFSSAKFYTFDTMSVATNGTMTLYTNKYEFDQYLWVRRIQIVYKNAVSNNGNPGQLSLYDAAGFINSIGSSGSLSLLNSSGGTEYIHELAGLNVKLNILQLRLISDTGVPGFKEIIVWTDPANI